MKNLKKKLFMIALAIVMLICLVACSGDIKVTVEFDTLGGSEVASIELTEDQIGSFTLPENPTKVGFVFVGWYLDENLETLFEKIDIIEGTIKLYAKWEPEKTANELTKEKLVGSWAGPSVGCTFDQEDTFVLTFNNITYSGKYEIKDDGTFDFVSGVSILPAIKGYIEGDELKINILAVDLVLKKIPSFEFELLDSKFDLEKFNGITFEDTLKLDFLLNINMIDHEATDKAILENPNAETIYKDLPIQIKLDCKLTGIIENITIKDIKDLKLAFKLEGLFGAYSDTEVESEEYETFKKCFEEINVYILNGYAYININLPTSHEEEVTEGDITKTITVYDNTPTSLKLNLKTLIDYAIDELFDTDSTIKSSSLLPAFKMYSLNRESFDVLIETFNIVYNQLLTRVYSMGISEKNITDINELINSILPEVTKDGEVTTIYYDKEKLTNIANDVKEFVNNNKALIGIIYSLANGSHMTEQDWLETVEGINKLPEEIAKVIDLDSLKLVLVDDGNGSYKEINGVFDIRINISDTKKSYIDILFDNNFKVTGHDGIVEVPNETKYVDFTDKLLDNDSGIEE